MREQSNEVKGLKDAFARAALAVFAFAVLTAWPLLAGMQSGDWGRPQVALVSQQGNPVIDENTSCQT
jgi:hypothetical protein